MADYSVKRAVGSRTVSRPKVPLRRHAYQPFDRDGGSLLEVLRPLYATNVPWEVIEANSREMAVHAALLPTGDAGKVLYFGGDYHAHFSYLHDLATGEISETEGPNDMPFTVTTDMFCSGHSMLHDGSILVAGGQLPAPGGEQDQHNHGGIAGGGERACYIFGPESLGWRQVSDLNLDPSGAPNSGGRWYPTLLTLSTGHVLAVGGHPDVREVWPDESTQRHSNNIPERYHPVQDTWTLLEDEEHTQTTADNPVTAYDYQRIHLLPDGRVFFSSAVRGANRIYDAATGVFDDDRVIALPPEGSYRNATSMAVYTSVILPLLHEEGYVARVLLAGDTNSFVYDFGAGDDAEWEQTSGRDWRSPPARRYSITTLLPTGDVFLSGGSEVGGAEESQAAVVLEGEIFSPNFDVANVGTDEPVFRADLAAWTTVEPAAVGRRYHSTALLLPDGTVWHAGSNGTLDFELPDDEQVAELRVEIYRPPYMQAVDRPRVVNAPDHVEPGEQFDVDFTTAHEIDRVVFLRNGSVTHGFNSDQRMITAAFTKTTNHRLRVTAPPNHSIAPAGFYMLWLIDTEGSPCERAPFIHFLET